MRSARRAVTAALAARGRRRGLAGCVTTQQRNERAEARRRAHARQPRAAADRRAQPRTCACCDVALVRGAAAARSSSSCATAARARRPTCRSRSASRAPAGGARRSTAAAGSPTSRRTSPAIGAGETPTWVFTTRRALPRGARPFAVAGAPRRAPAAAARRSCRRWPAPPVRGQRRLRVTVAQRRDVPQYGLPVYAFARARRPLRRRRTRGSQHLGTRATRDRRAVPRRRRRGAARPDRSRCPRSSTERTTMTETLHPIASTYEPCAHCGAPLDERQRYCVVCGARRRTPTTRSRATSWPRAARERADGGAAPPAPAPARAGPLAAASPGCCCRSRAAAACSSGAAAPPTAICRGRCGAEGSRRQIGGAAPERRGVERRAGGASTAARRARSRSLKGFTVELRTLPAGTTAPRSPRRRTAARAGAKRRRASSIRSSLD